MIIEGQNKISYFSRFFAKNKLIFQMFAKKILEVSGFQGLSS